MKYNYKTFLKQIDAFVNGNGNIETKWLSGGMRGGNCWGDDADTEIDGESPPEIDELDRVLEIVCPNITFLKYKKLRDNLVKNDSEEERGYYGNYYIYSIRCTNAKELFDYLCENNLIEQG